MKIPRKRFCFDALKGNEKQKLQKERLVHVPRGWVMQLMKNNMCMNIKAVIMYFQFNFRIYFK